MNIYEKLAELQEEFKAPKSEYNKHGGFKYRSLEPMLKELKPLLRKHKCLVFFKDKLDECAETPHVVAEVTLINLENTEEIILVTASAQEAAIQKGMQAAQISGSTSSYARKYALAGLLAVDDEEDLDSKDAMKSNSRVSKSGDYKASHDKPASSAQKKFLAELYIQYQHRTADQRELITWMEEEHGIVEPSKASSADISDLIQELKDE